MAKVKNVNILGTFTVEEKSVSRSRHNAIFDLVGIVCNAQRSRIAQEYSHCQGKHAAAVTSLNVTGNVLGEHGGITASHHG